MKNELDSNGGARGKATLYETTQPQGSGAKGPMLI